MTPALLLILLVGLAVGGLAHAVWGRALRQLPVFLLAALAAALIATLVGWQLPLGLPAPAGVPLLEAALLGWTFTAVVARLRI